MRNLALAFCFSALLGAGFVACGDDSSASAADTLSSSSEITKVPEPAEGTSSSVNLPVSSETSMESVEVSSSSEIAVISSESALSSSVAVDVSSSSAAPESSSDEDDGDDGKCTACDSYTAADPELTENGGKGSVTTYGSITAKETSLGGACNYGQTNIQYYAAIHVNVSPGDEKGPWNGGAACGGCVRVKAKTPDGWKHVTVRITC